jgi:large subunit ribosomal protein L16
MFEIEGVTKEIAQKALGLAAAKLGVKSKFIAREEAHTE